MCRSLPDLADSMLDGGQAGNDAKDRDQHSGGPRFAPDLGRSSCQLFAFRI